MIYLIPIAFISGALTALSPCVIPLLPIVVGRGLEGKQRKTFSLIAGLVLSYTLIVLSFSFIVDTLGISIDLIRNIAVVFLAIIAVLLLIPKLWDRIQVEIEKKINLSSGLQEKNLGDFLTGFSLGILWLPCTGPIIAAITTLILTSGIGFVSILAVFAYALGAGIVLYFIATASGKLANLLNFAKKNSTLMRQIFGGLILITAIAIFFGLDRELQVWTIENLPEQWTFLAETFERRVGIEQSELMEGL